MILLESSQSYKEKSNKSAVMLSIFSERYQLFKECDLSEITVFVTFIFSVKQYKMSQTS